MLRFSVCKVLKLLSYNSVLFIQNYMLFNIYRNFFQNYLCNIVFHNFALPIFNCNLHFPKYTIKGIICQHSFFFPFFRYCNFQLNILNFTVFALKLILFSFFISPLSSMKQAPMYISYK